MDKNLDDIVDEIDESTYDYEISQIFELSARIKSKSKLIKQNPGINEYYICMADKSIIKDIKSLGNLSLDVLYAALKKPLVLLYNNDVFYLKQKFDGLDVSYSIDNVKVEKNRLESLKNLYNNGKTPDIKYDEKFSTMYKISSEIKNKGFNIYFEDKGFSFYITEMADLGSNSKKILNYIANLNKTDLQRLSNITKLFSIIDTKKRKRYAIINYKEGNVEKLKFSGDSDNEEEYMGLCKILEIAKSKGEKFLTISSENDESYKPEHDAPSDMYR